jgi:hypothetical protein
VNGLPLLVGEVLRGSALALNAQREAKNPGDRGESHCERDDK